MLKNDEIDLIINTTEGEQAIADSFEIRRRALQHGVAYTTTIAGATAAVMAISRNREESVRCLQDLHQEFADG
jgi:carbamoyl-phosphate synthase large subunit